MDNTLAILIPTRNRKDLLAQCLDDLKWVVAYRPVIVYLVFDGDWDGYKDFDHRVFDMSFTGQIFHIEHGEYIEAINTMAELAYAAGCEYFMPWSDDSFLKGERPMRKVIRALRAAEGPRNKSPVVMALNNPYWGDRLGTHAMLNRAMVDYLDYGNGKIFFPGYTHYGGDNELTARAKKAGYFHFIEDVEIEHPPPTETQNNPSMEYKDHDEKLWGERKVAIDAGEI